MEEEEGFTSAWWHGLSRAIWEVTGAYNATYHSTAGFTLNRAGNRRLSKLSSELTPRSTSMNMSGVS